MAVKTDKSVPISPVKGNAKQPKCFGKKLVEHMCITCSWQERCLYESYKQEIMDFKKNNSEEYFRIRHVILNTTSFEE
jgi:hypothetical protein